MTEEPVPRRRLVRIVGSTWSAAGTGIAVLASGVALTFTLMPGLTPDPRAVLAAAVTVQTVEPGVSLGSYRARFQPELLKGRLTAEDRTANAGPGDVVYLHVQIQGKKHGSLTLDTLRYSWATKKLLADEMPVIDQGFIPNTPNDQWIAPVWVADPQLGQAFFVRLRVMDGPVMLAFADTKRISAQ